MRLNAQPLSTKTVLRESTQRIISGHWMIMITDLHATVSIARQANGSHLITSFAAVEIVMIFVVY